MTEQEIIQEYLNGKSISALARENKEYSYIKIQKILRENQISIRGGRKKKSLSEEQLKQFKIDVEINNLMNQELQEKYKLDIATLKRIAFENNIKKPNYNKINRKIKSDYFSIIDYPEKAYWIGFLFTNGSVNESNRTDKSSARIRFQLQESDKEILEKFQQDLGLESKLIYDKRENKHCYSVEFVDNQIYNDLAQFGIIPQKTYKTEHLQYEKIPKKFLPAYILGLFDGDGCLTYSNDCFTDVSLSFTSYHENIAKDFQELVDNQILNKQEHNKLIFTSAWHTQWRGRLQVLQILGYLYENCPRHLDRKYQKYLILKNSLN